MGYLYDCLFKHSEDVSIVSLKNKLLTCLSMFIGWFVLSIMPSVILYFTNPQYFEERIFIPEYFVFYGIYAFFITYAWTMVRHNDFDLYPRGYVILFFYLIAIFLDNVVLFTPGILSAWPNYINMIYYYNWNVWIHVLIVACVCVLIFFLERRRMKKF